MKNCIEDIRNPEDKKPITTCFEKEKIGTKNLKQRIEKESNYDWLCHADVDRNHKEEIKETKKREKEKKRNNKGAICPKKADRVYRKGK